jgi:hypothetical protein
MPTKVECPSCAAVLKLGEVDPEAKIRCPKCRASFTIPSRGAERAAAKASNSRPRKPAPPPEEEEEEDFEDEPRQKPKFKKKRRQKQAVSNAPLIIGLSAAGVLVLGLVGFGVYWFANRNPEAVAQNDASKPAAGPTLTPLKIGQGPRRQQPEEPGAQQEPDAPASPPEGGTGGGGGSGEFAVGKRVFEESCTRCHKIGDAGRGRDLSAVGRDSSHTVDWLMAFIRDPKAVRPNARMRGFDENKLSEADLRALAEYLASLK